MRKSTSMRDVLAASLVATIGLLPAMARAADAGCEPQTLLDVAKIDKQIVMVGEAHGTREFPGFTGGLVCSLLKAGRSVILAIEHDGREQEALDRYIVSAGGLADREALLQGRAWQQQRCQDGRTSQAMFELIESMRRLRQGGQRVAVLAFDRNESFDIPATPAELTPLSADENAIVSRGFDRTMADNIVYAAVLYRRYTVVVLSGHTYTTARPIEGFVSMGTLVDRDVPSFFINFDTEGGSHWQAGAGGCKERPLPAGRRAEGSKTDALVKLGRITASLPAVNP